MANLNPDPGAGYRLNRELDRYNRRRDAGPGAGYRNLRVGEQVKPGDQRLCIVTQLWRRASLLGIQIIPGLEKIYRRKV